MFAQLQLQRSPQVPHWDKTCRFKLHLEKVRQQRHNQLFMSFSNLVSLGPRFQNPFGILLQFSLLEGSAGSPTEPRVQTLVEHQSQQPSTEQTQRTERNTSENKTNHHTRREETGEERINSSGEMISGKELREKNGGRKKGGKSHSQCMKTQELLTNHKHQMTMTTPSSPFSGSHNDGNE